VGFVDNTLYDASSILKFIEYNYNLSSIGTRDAMANNLLNAFDFAKEPGEPLTLGKGYIKNLSQEVENNLILRKNVHTVNLIYLVILPSIVIMWFGIFWITYKRQGKLGLTRY
jgi:hypothetical protein